MHPHETESFTAFFRQSYPRLVILVMKDGAGQADAHDAAQEAMVEAYLRWAEIRSPYAWVCKVALRTYRRGARRARERTAPLVDDQIPAGAETNPDVVTDGELLIVKVISQLPPQQRRVAALYYDGFGHEEIAELLGKPEATVRSLLRHARERLQELLYVETSPSAKE